MSGSGSSHDPYRLPVLVGVGQLRCNRERTVEGSREPLHLIVAAIRRAAQDLGAAASLVRDADAIDVVCVVSWAYDDLPGLIASRIGALPRLGRQSDVGGHQPPRLLDEAARRIAAGECRIALVCSGEALASVAALRQAGVDPDWSRAPGGRVRIPQSSYASELMVRYGLSLPVRAYPLYENRLRADLGQTFAESQRWSAEMYADFSRVAAGNDAAWDPVVRSPDEIATVGPRNRMICFPYPLLMNAHLAVDQAAAVVVTSLGTARDRGVPEDRVVHIWGGAGSADSTDVLARVSYGRAPGMAAAFDQALAQCGVSAEDLDVVDLYSCFPVVPKLASRALRLPAGTGLSATGGLTSFGGPANAYCLHAAVAVARRVRAGARLGLVYGNGGLLTGHHAILLAAEPHAAGYLGRDGLVAPSESQGPRVVDRARGRATVETHTVEYDRQGSPTLGYVVCRLLDGSRAPAHAVDPATLAALTDTAVEAVGRRGRLEPQPDGRNLFRMEGP